MLEIDCLGTFHMSKACFLHSMKQRKQGNIINISTTLHWNGSILTGHAGAAKAGVDAMTKNLAVEWGPYGVRVNSLTPGAIEGTEGFARLGNLGTMNNKKATENARNASQEDNMLAAPLVPLQRYGVVQDISNTALYLASPASDYVTGWNVVADGGAFLTAPNMLVMSPVLVERWARAKL